MTVAVFLLFLVGIHISRSAVILRDASSDPSLQVLSHPHEFSSISISQNFDNKFGTEVSSSSLSSGIPQYLHQGNNLFFNPQLQLPGNFFPVLIEDAKVNCDEKLTSTMESQKQNEFEKHEEIEEQKEPALEMEQEVLNDDTEKELIDIPAPPELPPLSLPELPVPVDVANNDKHDCHTNESEQPVTEKKIDNPVHDEMQTTSEVPRVEDVKPIIIPAPPTLPPLALPELPVKVIVPEPIQPPVAIESPALPVPCEDPIESTLPLKPIDVLKEHELIAPVTIPSGFNIFEFVNHDKELISIPEKPVTAPMYVAVFEPHPISIPQISVPQIAFNADAPPCPPQYPQNEILQVHDYVNNLGPQYQGFNILPYKK